MSENKPIHDLPAEASAQYLDECHPAYIVEPQTERAQRLVRHLRHRILLVNDTNTIRQGYPLPSDIGRLIEE